jgi:hypothetical protein
LKTVYVLSQVGYEYNDSTYDTTENSDGTPVVVFNTYKEAEESLIKQTVEDFYALAYADVDQESAIDSSDYKLIAHGHDGFKFKENLTDLEKYNIITKSLGITYYTITEVPYIV